MKQKPNILIIGDMPGWAFHQMIDFVRTHIRDYQIYYDFTIYNPSSVNSVQSDVSFEHNTTVQNSYRKRIPFQRIPGIKGLVYRLVKVLNQYGVLRFNEEGLFRRIKDDNSYDLVVYLDYYMDVDADFMHLKAGKTVKGIFTAQFPPKGIALEKEITLDQFCAQYLSNCDALLVGAPSINQTYHEVFKKPIFFANMAYNEQLFRYRSRQRKENEPFIIGWSGNPNRDFKGFYTHVIPTVETLNSLGYSVALKTQFEGEFSTLVDFWNSVDLALIASNADAGPSMFMEASLCGIPSVSTRVGMPLMVIEDGVNGVFCERNVEDMVNNIKSLIENHALYNTMRSSIRSSYIRKLGVEVQIENWKSLFQSMIHE